MQVNVYKRYDFKYDPKLYMKNLKEEFDKRGDKSLSSFYNVLISVLPESNHTKYEIARSYYNLRRTMPFSTLAKLALKYDLNVSNIMFPNAYLKEEYNIPLTINYPAYFKTFDSFNTVFHLAYENLEILETDAYQEELNIVLPHLIKALSKYNYLIQKYYFSKVCLEELKEITIFSNEFIVDKVTGDKFDIDKFNDWIKNLDTNDFLNDFYNKYSLCFKEDELKVRLGIIKDIVSEDIYKVVDAIFNFRK